MTSRSNLSKEVQTRLAAGESKSSIYNALKGSFAAKSVERSLAQWPLPTAKKRNQPLNMPLLIMAVFFALLVILNIAPQIRQLPPAQAAIGVVVIIIHLYTVYGIINGNLIGYMLIILMSLRNIAGILQGGISDPKMGMLLAMSAAAILLAFLQKRRLFPNTSWFLRHKRDSDGHPIF